LKESNSFFIISLIPADKLIVISATIIKKIFKYGITMIGVKIHAKA
jgi:hypothetical protein